MKHKTRILLKLTGKILVDDKGAPTSTYVRAILEQIKRLENSHQFGIVIGGGNLFRGNQEGKQLGLTSTTGDQLGMLATVMNGLALQDICAQGGIESSIFSALTFPEIGINFSQQLLQRALQKGTLVIFAGGLGNPFFTTDTTAIVRALQMEAAAVWKGTSVDGVYNDNPLTNVNAYKLSTLSYQDAIIHNLKIMDQTAYSLAAQHRLPIRVFNIFSPSILEHVVNDTTIGSTIL